MKRFLTVLLISCISVTAYGQITVTFVPEVQGRTLEAVMGARLMNGGPRLPCILQIRITSADGGLIAEATTPAFELPSGMNMVPQAAAFRAAWKFGTNRQAVVVKQSHQFPEGEYEYCFTLQEAAGSHAGAVLAEQCFNHMLVPFSPLELTEPFDGDRICEKRPTLFWQPLLPALPGMTYRLLLVEMKEGQPRAEALHFNMPVIRQSGIPSPMLLYPPLSRELTEGRHYAWQVTAVKGETVLARSEIWDFMVQCEDSAAQRPADSYRNIEDLAKGNFYIAEGMILFAVDNHHHAQKLEYSIVSISAPGEPIRKLPKLSLDNGRNHVRIDLEAVKGMIDGHYYLLSVRMPDGQTKQLRFMYKTVSE